MDIDTFLANFKKMYYKDEPKPDAPEGYFWNPISNGGTVSHYILSKVEKKSGCKHCKSNSQVYK